MGGKRAGIECSAMHRIGFSLTAAVLLALATLPCAAQEPAASRYRDAVTGTEIVNLTGPGMKSSDLYYHFSNLTADEQAIIFVAERDGVKHIFTHDLRSGANRQITNDPRISAATACPLPGDAGKILAFRGPELLRISLASGSAEVVGRISGEVTGGAQQPTVNGAGTHAATGFRRNESTWEIGRIDLKTGAYQTVIQQGFHIGHVQYHPRLEEIFYVWETGGYAPQRSWLVNSDGSGNRPFYASTVPAKWYTRQKEWLTHESWVSGTGAMTMIMSEQGILLVQPSGEWKMIFEGRYWHVHARADGKVIVADDQRGRIWLGNVETGDLRLLVSHYRRAVPSLHAHAAFSSSGRYIVFNDGNRHESVSYIDLANVSLPEWFRPQPRK